MVGKGSLRISSNNFLRYTIEVREERNMAYICKLLMEVKMMRNKNKTTDANYSSVFSLQ